jgi:hypothetical protein
VSTSESITEPTTLAAALRRISSLEVDLDIVRDQLTAQQKAWNEREHTWLMRIAPANAHGLGAYRLATYTVINPDSASTGMHTVSLGWVQDREQRAAIDAGMNDHE